MKRFLKSAQLFFAKNYDVIKLGFLIGLLISNLILLNKQSQTLSEVLRVNEQLKSNIEAIDQERKTAKEDSERRDNIII